MAGQEIVIVGADGREHVFPTGFDPKKAAGIVRQQSAPPAPGPWARLNAPLLPQIGRAGRAAANWIDQPRADAHVPSWLRKPIAMQRGLMAGSLEGVANVAEGFTSPVGIATTLAGVPAARLVAPALVPAVSTAQRVAGGGAGAIFAAEGAKTLATAPTWSEKAAAIPQVAGGLMGVTAGMAPTVARMQANRAAKIPLKIDAELSHAFPASHAAPYTAADMATAAPFALAQHRIRPATTTLDAIEAFNGGVRVVEQRIDDIIAQFPHVRAQSSALADVRAAMGNDVEAGALEKGLRSLRGLLDLHQPASLTRLEAVRRRLNAQNQAHLDRNQYDRATARETDPAFRAREIAAESVRESIYGTLEQQGAPGIADFRRAEGSIIKVRNAAERQHYSGEKVVSGAAPSVKAEIGAAVTQAGMTAAGTGAGLLVGMPIPGAITGSVLGQQLGRKIRGHRVVRDELVARAFGRAAQDTRVPTMPPVPSRRPVRGALPPRVLQGEVVDPPPPPYVDAEIIPPAQLRAGVPPRPAREGQPSPDTSGPIAPTLPENIGNARRVRVDQLPELVPSPSAAPLVVPPVVAAPVRAPIKESGAQKQLREAGEATAARATPQLPPPLPAAAYQTPQTRTESGPVRRARALREERQQRDDMATREGSSPISMRALTDIVRDVTPAPVTPKPATTPTVTPTKAATIVERQLDRVVDVSGAKSSADIQLRILKALSDEMEPAMRNTFKEITIERRGGKRADEYGIIVDGERVGIVQHGRLSLYDQGKDHSVELPVSKADTGVAREKIIRLAAATELSRVKGSGVIRVQIPGDGAFTIARNPAAIAETMARIQKAGAAVWSAKAPVFNLSRELKKRPR